MEVKLVEIPCPICVGVSFSEERKLNGFNLVKCMDCNFVYCNPRPTEKFLAEAYNTNDWDFYNKFFAVENVDTEAWLEDQSPRQIKSYKRLLSKIKNYKEGGALLDIGCSNGMFLGLANKNGFKVKGIDVNIRAKNFPKDIELFEGTIQEANYQQNEFDVVFSQAVLEHLVHPDKMIKESWRILKPGGLFVLAAIPNYHSLMILLGKDKFIGNMPPNHLNYFTIKTLGRLITNYNFKILQKYCWGVSETVLYKTNWASDHKKNSRGGVKFNFVNLFGKLLYKPINSSLNYFNVGSVMEFFCLKPSE